MMNQEDYYKMLQVDPAAEPEVIVAAYRRLAQKYHPDAQPDPVTARRMRELNIAYEVLSNPAKRVQYDQIRAFQVARSRLPIGFQGLQPAPNPLVYQPAARAHSVLARSPTRRWSYRWVAAAVIGLAALLIMGTAALLLGPAFDAPEESRSRIWLGECRNPAGYVYTCRVRIKINAVNRVTGSVVWTLKVSPRVEEQLALGRQGRASVRGTFDPASRRITMGSHSQDDPFDIIDANEYALTLSTDERTLSGATYDDGIQFGSLTATLNE